MSWIVSVHCEGVQVNKQRTHLRVTNTAHPEPGVTMCRVERREGVPAAVDGRDGGAGDVKPPSEASRCVE